MAKGDRQQVQDAIGQYGNNASNNQDNLNKTLYGQYGDMYNNYRGSVDEDRSSREGLRNDYAQAIAGIRNDRNNINNQFNDEYEGYKNFAGFGGSGAGPSMGGAGGVSPDVIQGYRDFMSNGGFSDADISNLRARAIAPTRAAYANAQRGIERQRALQGGYSPGATSALTRMAREQGQSIADANTNAEASIAQARQQGKLA